MPARHKILMCRPDHFTVSYNINPWMDGEEGEVSRGRALAQWQALRDVLARVAEVELIPAQPQLPDMVFTANAGVVNGRRVIVSRFSPPERRGEEPHFRDWFASRGFELVAWPEELVFEGAGDALLDRGGPWVWAGYGQRTALAAHERLAAFYPERETVSLRLVDPYYYHIDTCLAPLEGGYLLYYPEAFDEEGRAAIERRVAPERRIAVNAAEADALSCNAVNLDRHVFLNNPSERLRNVLETAGFEVTGVDVSEFMKSGGAAKCLVLRLDEP
ncbi:MAG TPA: dimethylarginine dimethylaminohydrolase family protein [Gammaproteobacteria bacterium]|nr:dimethylarginine dimethylaminohydrolase family protein [Gammaproteobacteria bacterium]